MFGVSPKVNTALPNQTAPDTSASNQPKLSAGMRIPFPKQGEAPPKALSAEWMSLIVAVCNAVLNAKVSVKQAQTSIDGVPDLRGGISFSQQGALIEIFTGGGSGGGSGMNYRGEYSSATAYNAGDVVRVSPTNPAATPSGTCIPGVYVNILASTGTAPKHPLQTGGENANWNYLDTWPSAITSCDQDGNTITEFADAQPSHS